jgi:hypothetical protein
VASSAHDFQGLRAVPIFPLGEKVLPACYNTAETPPRWKDLMYILPALRPNPYDKELRKSGSYGKNKAFTKLFSAGDHDSLNLDCSMPNRGSGKL